MRLHRRGSGTYGAPGQWRFLRWPGASVAEPLSVMKSFSPNFRIADGAFVLPGSVCCRYTHTLGIRNLRRGLRSEVFMDRPEDVCLSKSTSVKPGSQRRPLQQKKNYPEGGGEPKLASESVEDAVKLRTGSQKRSVFGACECSLRCLRRIFRTVRRVC